MKKVKVKAWAIKSRGGVLRCSVSGRLYVYLKRKDANNDKWYDETVVRVEIREPERRAKKG